MKRLSSVTLALLVSATFLGCQKDGVFNPKNKISKVYRTDEGNKILREVWTWEENTLNNIASYSNDSTMRDKWYYLYKKKQLVRIESTLDLSYLALSYSGSNYDKIDYYDKYDKKRVAYVYTYDGKKVSRIDLTVYKNPSKSAMDISDNSLLSAFVPMAILKETNRQIMNTAHKSLEDDVFTYMLKYDGDNLSEWKIINNNDVNRPIEVTFLYDSYDKNFNPYYKSYPDVGGMEMGDPCFHKNNPVKVTVNVVENGIAVPSSVTYDYYYKYNDKKFPTEIIKKITQEPYSYSDTTYYEY